MELDRENLGEGRPRTGFFAWKEKNPKTFETCSVLVFLFGGIYLINFEEKHCIMSNGNGFISDVFIMFFLLSFLLFWWLIYKYAWRRQMKIRREGGKVLKQWKVIKVSFFLSLAFNVFFFGAYLVPVADLFDNMMANESKVVRTVITDKDTQKTGRYGTGTAYYVKFSIDVGRAELKVNKKTYDGVRVGDTIVLSVRYGYLGCYVDDYKIFNKVVREREFKKKEPEEAESYR